MENKRPPLKDAYEIARYIKEAKKVTPVKVYLKGDLGHLDFTDFRVFGDDHFAVLFGDYEQVFPFLAKNVQHIADYEMEADRRNSAIPMLDIKSINARIEPGALIRDFVKIGDRAVIMMGAVINIAAEIGEATMVDMNAVVGARAVIGKNCHIGAGAVVAGVLEPPSRQPVVIEDDVLIGANAVILEGIRIGRGAVVAAGAVVTSDVMPNAVVAGMPAKVIKMKDEKTIEKTKILDDLRK